MVCGEGRRRIGNDRAGQGGTNGRGSTRRAATGAARGVPAFACLPTPALEELAEQLEEDLYPPGAVMVAEGEAGDRLYLIAEGRAEVSTAGQNGPVPLAKLGQGELFGEIALLEPGGRR